MVYILPHVWFYLTDCISIVILVSKTLTNNVTTMMPIGSCEGDLASVISTPTVKLPLVEKVNWNQPLWSSLRIPEQVMYIFTVIRIGVSTRAIPANIHLGSDTSRGRQGSHTMPAQNEWDSSFYYGDAFQLATTFQYIGTHIGFFSAERPIGIEGQLGYLNPFLLDGSNTFSVCRGGDRTIAIGAFAHQTFPSTAFVPMGHSPPGHFEVQMT